MIKKVNPLLSFLSGMYRLMIRVCADEQFTDEKQFLIAQIQSL